MNIKSKVLAILGSVALAAFALTGCNTVSGTVRGAGEDVQSVVGGGSTARHDVCHRGCKPGMKHCMKGCKKHHRHVYHNSKYHVKKTTTAAGDANSKTTTTTTRTDTSTTNAY